MPSDPPLTENGPNILCIGCGAICNHVRLRCAACRNVMADEGPTKADLAYLAWKQQRDAERKTSSGVADG